MKVVKFSQVPPLTDVVARLRRMADQIESGEVEADAVFVLIPVENDFPNVFGFGDVEGRDNHPIVQFELAKAMFINNLIERD